MASVKLRYPDNAAGSFYVDSTCIDCDACRRIAPETFTEASDHSFVERQPESEAERRRAMMALVACPTGSIGTTTREDARPAIASFPETVEEEVSFCGFTSPDSFGAWSYFVERPAGNVLVDSPKAVPRLLSEFERRGGVATMFLTHRDDVADHGAFRKRFSCDRVLHEADLSRGTADVETVLRGEEPVALGDDLVAIPTPGHTRGHAVLLYREKFLFTGDHLAWSRRGGAPVPRPPERSAAEGTAGSSRRGGAPVPRPPERSAADGTAGFSSRNGLVAFRDACWYSWKEQTRSMERLIDYRFEWVLPGHGGWWRAESAAAMRREIERCVRWMRSLS